MANVRSVAGVGRRSTGAEALGYLSWAVGLLALVAAVLGLAWTGGTGPTTFVTVRGDVVDMFGRGLYRYDSLLAGAGARGTDAVTIFLAVPLLFAASLRSARGSLRGGLALSGSLVWFLYVYGSYSLGTSAYNELFLLYVVLFSASLFALFTAARSLEGRLAPHVGRLPRRGLAAFMIVSGVATFGIWIADPLAASIRGGVPDALASYSTLFTYAIDLAVVVPAAILAGVLILRRAPLGYLMAVGLLALEAMLAPMIAAQTVSQLAAGVQFTTAAVVGPIGGFVVLSLMAAGFLVQLLGSLPRESGRAPSPREGSPRLPA